MKLKKDWKLYEIVYKKKGPLKIFTEIVDDNQIIIKVKNIILYFLLAIK